MCPHLLLLIVLYVKIIHLRSSITGPYYGKYRFQAFFSFSNTYTPTSGFRELTTMLTETRGVEKLLTDFFYPGTVSAAREISLSVSTTAELGVRLVARLTYSKPPSYG